MKSRHTVNHTALSAALNISLLAVVAALLVFGIFLVRAKLLMNAQMLGIALAHSYAAEEQQNIESLKRYAQLASMYIEEISADGGNTSTVQSWLEAHFEKLTRITGESTVDQYAVISGQIVAANPWEGDAGYDYTQTNWYRQAIEADGELVVSDVYPDAITGRRIFTISRALEQPGDVFGLAVYIQNPSMHVISQTLPEEAAYYLCDQDGMLLCWMSDWDITAQTAQSHVDHLLAGMRDGSLMAYDASFTGLDGQQRGAYYCQMDNGWTVILTLPLNSILMGDRNVVIYAIAGVAFILFAALSMMTLRNMVQSRRVKRSNDTAHMLGDSFYAIFRVNFRQGVYEAIKLYPDMLGVLPWRGDYALVMNAMKPLVKSSTYQAFEHSFSLSSIYERVLRDVPDYGGDYQRLFSGKYRWVNVRTLYDSKVAPDEVILCFRDVDEEKRRELRHMNLLQDALDAAQSSTRARSEFFSRMSHDMRTPLNAIIGSCELARRVRESGGGDRVWDYMDKIEFAGRQLLALINDILELSRMEAGKGSLSESEFNLRRLLANIADMFGDLAARDDKAFNVSIDIADDAVVGDAQKIVQVLNNLLSNSLKYSDAGAVIRLDVRQFEAQPTGKYQFIVEDTGIGMSPDFLKHLFDPYSRETVFSERSKIGTGLGMPIVKNLVQQMSGEISVESELGRGSRFTVTLPLKIAPERGEANRASDARSEAAAPARAAQPAAESAPAADGAQLEPFSWENRTILVAEDNELNMEILTSMLEMMGARVICAANGAEAVSAFERSQPGQIDAVLMDMQMPVMDGCQAAEAIRALDRPDAADTPIIAVTANAYAEDIARTTRAGMDSHVSKPIDMALLTQTLEKRARKRAAD